MLKGYVEKGWLTMAKMTNDQLRQLQALPLDIKIRKTEIRIREWYEHWGGQCLRIV